MRCGGLNRCCYLGNGMEACSICDYASGCPRDRANVSLCYVLALQRQELVNRNAGRPAYFRYGLETN